MMPDDELPDTLGAGAETEALPDAATADVGQADDRQPDKPASPGELVPIDGRVVEPFKPQKGGPGEWRPIIPAWILSGTEVKRRAKWHYRKKRHQALYHLVRFPWRACLTCAYAGVGAARIVYAQISWAWVAEQTYLRAEAVEAGDTRTWLTLHNHVRAVRRVRIPVLIVEAGVLTVGGALVTLVIPWLWWPVGAVTIPVLAYIGRPVDKPIMQAAVVPQYFDPLTRELIVTTLGSLGIGEMNKAITKDPEKAIVLYNPIMRDGPGWRADVDLPHGVTAAEVAERRERLASGLRRPLGCVWPETDHRRHPGALNLWVGDEDMTTAQQPAWPLAKRGTVDLFAPVQVATDPRGRPVTVTLMFASLIIGGVPRMGKSYLLRLLLLIAALDVRAELHIYDLKGTGDQSCFEPVAHRYRAVDDMDPEDMDYVMAGLRGLRSEMRSRTRKIRAMPRTVVPEAKVTPDLASNPKAGLHPIVVAIDETQVLFEHPIYGEEAEQIVTDLVKRGPALGILAWLATQRPDDASIPRPISDNAVLRACLRVVGHIANDLVLGTGAWRNGYRAAMFSLLDKGIMWFAGEGINPVICKGHGYSNLDAEPVIARAYAARKAAGRITGYAAGIEHDEPPRVFTADVLTVFRDDEDKVTYKTIAERLGEQMPEVYADITPAAVSSQLRAAEVRVKTVRERGQKPAQGCEREAVHEAAAAEIERRRQATEPVLATRGV